MAFSFEEQLGIGKRYEKYFAEHFPLSMKPVERSDYNGDFVFPNGETLELKTEYGYCLNSKHEDTGVRYTKNVFIERFSKVHTRVIGGPWKALENRMTYYCHYFPHDNKCFLWETYKLVKYLDEEVIRDKKLINIKNEDWVTQGYVVPLREINMEQLYELTFCHVFSLETK